MHNVKRVGDNEHFAQVRPKSGDGSPAWYAPHRDALHNYNDWMRAALKRLEDQEIPDETQEKILRAVQDMARLVNEINEGKFAGKPEEMEVRLKKMVENGEGYGYMGAAFMTEMLWRFWYFAGEVSLRQEGPIKL